MVPLFPGSPPAPYHCEVRPGLTRMPLWHSDTPGWDSDAEQMCLSITLITVFTHTILYSEIKSTQTSYLWKVLFPNVIEIRIPAHPSGKEKKKTKTKIQMRTWATYKGCRWLVAKVLWRCGRALTMPGCRAVRGSGWRRQRQKGVCWETESTAQPRSQGEEGGSH